MLPPSESAADWQSHVRAALRDPTWTDRLVALARETMASTPGWSPNTYDDATVREAIRGFVGVLEEGLGGTSDEVRRLFMETAIPAFVAAGELPEVLVGGAATYQVLIALELVSAVPAEARPDTARWMAAFAGSYVSDVSKSATRSAS